jgi:hypothetical protein
VSSRVVWGSEDGLLLCVLFRQGVQRIAVAASRTNSKILHFPPCFIFTKPLLPPLPSCWVFSRDVSKFKRRTPSCKRYSVRLSFPHCVCPRPTEIRNFVPLPTSHSGTAEPPAVGEKLHTPCSLSSKFIPLFCLYPVSGFCE